MKRKTVRKFPIFYLCLLLFVLLAAVAVFIGIRILTDWLADYEQSLPKHVAEEVFSEWYQGDFAEKLLKKVDFSVSPFESMGDAADKLKEKIGGNEITFGSVSTGMSDDKKYNVRAGDAKISSFTLKKTGEKSKHGSDLYSLAEMKVFLDQPVKKEILVPDGYSLMLNGKNVGDDYRTETGIETTSCDHMPEGVNGLTYSRYCVSSLLREGSWEVLSPDGRQCGIALDPKENCPRAQIVYDEALEKEMSEYVVTAAKKYAAFMEMDGTRGSVLPYFEPGTPLYEGISTVEYYFVIDHTSYDFENVTSGEFFAYDENTFSCRVAFTHVLRKPGMPDFRDPLDYTFYLRKVNGTYLIYDCCNNK